MSHTTATSADHIERIVADFQQPLFNFAYSLSKSVHQSEDIVQQTFYIYLQKGGNLRDLSKVKSWLFTTLYREFLKQQRIGKRWESNEPQTLEAIAGASESNTQRQADGQLAVDALQEVEATYRAPLALYYLNDLSYKEIANTLSIPLGTVMSRLSRGKSRLREVFEQKTTASLSLN
jgi:RNA polymerase sigma factor, sigma-70 family